jgi:DNA-binding transcriptional LysR family regulator
VNLNHLKFAREVAGTGSFTEASKMCCVTQPTLSNGISQLEEALGGKLFERTTRKVSLTSFGVHMLPVILQMLDSRNEVEEAAEQFLNPVGKHLTIGFSPLADMRIIKAIVDLYSESKSGGPVFFKECFMEDLYERIEGETIELAICPGVGGRASEAGFSSFTFYQEPVFVLKKSSEESLSDAGGMMFVDELSDEVFALTPDLCGHAPATRQWFKQCGKTINEYPGHAVSYQVMQEWAELGIASAILPWSKINDVNRVKVSQLFLKPGVPAMLELKLVWKGDSRHCKQIEGFLAHCAERISPVVACLGLSDEKFQVATDKAS